MRGDNFFRCWRIISDSIRLKNSSKLVEGSLIAIKHLVLGAKLINLYFIGRVGEWFSQKPQSFSKKMLHIIFTFIFSSYLKSYTLKGSRNIQCFSLIRAILLSFWCLKQLLTSVFFFQIAKTVSKTSSIVQHVFSIQF